MPALNYNPDRFLWPVILGEGDESIAGSFRDQIREKQFPCVAAKAALDRGNIEIFVGAHLGCPADDKGILNFLYDFIDRLRNEPAKFRSAVILFRDATPMPEPLFDRFLWARLQALAELDRGSYGHDPRVSSDPSSPEFSFSLKEEAFYVIGMHAGSNRPARRSDYPALVFNPHVQFDELRKQGRYEPMQSAIRKRDLLFSGSVNPMLTNFGDQSEAMQYSGMPHESGWRCPLQQNSRQNGDYSPA